MDKKMFRKLSKILMIFCIIFQLNNFAFAVGISTSFAEVIIDNLKIGKTYNTREFINNPMRVYNNSEEKVKIYIDPAMPNESDLKPGMELIPDLSWINVSAHEIDVAPGGEAITDVIISIPNDTKYCGKRYMGYLYTRSAGKGNIHVGIYSKIVFSISKSTAQVAEEGRKQLMLANMNYQVLPYSFFVDKYQLGQEINVGNFCNVKFKIVNPNDTDYTYKITPLKIADSKTFLKEGFEDLPDDKFLWVKEKEVTVEGNAIKVIDLFIKIPDKKEYKGKKYMAIVKTELLNQEIKVENYTRVYIITN